MRKQLYYWSLVILFLKLSSEVTREGYRHYCHLVLILKKVLKRCWSKDTENFIFGRVRVSLGLVTQKRQKVTQDDC
jgi:hypothetical protein